MILHVSASAGFWIGYGGTPDLDASGNGRMAGRQRSETFHSNFRPYLTCRANRTSHGGSRWPKAPIRAVAVRGEKEPRRGGAALTSKGARTFFRIDNVGFSFAAGWQLAGSESDASDESSV